MVFGSILRPPSPSSLTGLPSLDDRGHNIQYHIRHLPTRSVRFSPARAHVIRDINNIPLKPGTNHVTLIGLSPTVDEHSIKVDGTGPAFIAGISVHLLPNKDIFDDIYPSSQDTDSDRSNPDSDPDSDLDTTFSQDDEIDALVSLRLDLAALQDDRQRAAELVASAEDRLKIINAYGHRLTANPPPLAKDDKPQPAIDIIAGLETYKLERDKAFRDHMAGMASKRAIRDKIDKLQKLIERQVKLDKKSKAEKGKSRAKASKAKHKAQQTRDRKGLERAKERIRVRKEREACWPRNIHVVRVTLETASFTPASSRRNSASSDVVQFPSSSSSEAGPERHTNTGTCSLTLSYMTTSAYWTPSYDLALSTVSNTAILCFDALLINHTSETWSNCKASLTTSQAESSNLTDKLPFLQAWQIKLADKDESTQGHLSVDSILYSREEQMHKQRRFFEQHGYVNGPPRSSMFGIEPHHQPPPPAGPRGGLFGSSQSTQVANTFGSNASVGASGSQPPSTATGSASAFGTPSGGGVGCGGSEASSSSATNAGSLFGQASSNGSGLFGGNRISNQTSGGLFGTGATAAVPTTTSALFGSSASTSSPQPASISLPGDAPRPAHTARHIVGEPAPTPMSFGQDETSFVQLGLTSNHELSGSKTIKPTGPTTSKIGGGSSRQRVARITFTDLDFTRTIVAKYKPVAYLRVRLRNSSKIPIISGPASVTLDGSFLGRVQLPPPPSPLSSAIFGPPPTCIRPGEYMHLDLGVDPAIRVTYSGPVAKKISQDSGAAAFLLRGSKDVTRTYTRSITLFNGRDHGNEGSLGSFGGDRSGSGARNEGKATPVGSDGLSAAVKPVTIKVLDQVPTTEDERLRISVLQPPGLTGDGNKIDVKSSGTRTLLLFSATGSKSSARGSPHGSGSDKDDDGSWGWAQASMLPSGQVEWDVTLHPSRMVKLTLEYQCSYPTGDSVISVT